MTVLKILKLSRSDGFPLGMSSLSTDLRAFLSFFPSVLGKIKNQNIQRAGMYEKANGMLSTMLFQFMDRSSILNLAHAYKMASQQQETVPQTNSRKSLLTPFSRKPLIYEQQKQLPRSNKVMLPGHDDCTDVVLTLSHVGDLIHFQPGGGFRQPYVTLLSLTQIKPKLVC